MFTTFHNHFHFSLEVHEMRSSIRVSHQLHFTLTKPVLETLKTGIQLTILPFFGTDNSTCCNLDNLCLICSLFLLKQLYKHKDVWVGTSTQSVELVVPSLNCICCSWAVMVEVVPHFKVSFNPGFCHIVLESHHRSGLVITILQGLEPHIFHTVTGNQRKDGCSSN